MSTSVLVLMGGPDLERAVSLDSGSAVAQALRDTASFEVHAHTIDRPDAEALRTLVHATGADVVFPVLHGAWGEGGPLQEHLDAIGVPYVGSRPEAAALAMDKLATKRLVERAGVATPPAQPLDPADACRLAPPLVLKPIADGSSVDLRICRTAAEVDAARAVLHPRRGRLLAERYIQGRELTVAILGESPLPIIEIVPAVEFYDYAAKYERDDTRYLLDPDLSVDIAEHALTASITAFRTLDCRDLARVDFMMDDEGLWFLEINTMPGFTSHSLVPMAAAHAGLDLPDLCARLVALAAGRPCGREASTASAACPRTGPDHP